MWRCTARRAARRSFVATLPMMMLSSATRSEEHTSELQSRFDLVCRLLLEKKKNNRYFFVIDGYRNGIRAVLRGYAGRDVLFHFYLAREIGLSAGAFLHRDQC